MNIELPDIKQTLLGPTCAQCNRMFLSLAGAILHQEEIDENGGICPNAKNTAPFAEARPFTST